MSVLDRITSIDDLRPEIFSILALRVEEALAARSKAELAAAEKTVTDRFRALFSRSPPKLRASALEAADADPLLVEAFRLGQLSFASHVLTTALAHRADDDFIPVLTEPALKPMIDLLKAGDQSLMALWKPLKRDMTFVDARKSIGRLIELGIVDFRQDGRDVAYYLTPVARAVLESFADA